MAIWVSLTIAAAAIPLIVILGFSLEGPDESRWQHAIESDDVERLAALANLLEVEDRGAWSEEVDLALGRLRHRLEVDEYANVIVELDDGRWVMVSLHSEGGSTARCTAPAPPR